ncbi:unannotated protein [freshwater metagenome]|uniref:Unannotated protein n=1 Tax=freshwater metagenome TaxID=449393 RepID=A0A6J7TL19_9ZZZZ|nr:hypothetical protein [Actinomycetota bacterium]
MEQIFIRELATIADQDRGLDLFDSIWPIPGGGREIPQNLMQAFVHNGAYFTGAFRGDEILGATFGFIGTTGGVHLHSHMSAVLPKSRDLGVGALMKHHQYAWALERDIPFITWTFDPLVKKNASFNISKLGVEITDYYPDFYGSMPDLVNAGDASDRLMAQWHVTAETSAPKVGLTIPPIDAITIAIPEDIVQLRVGSNDEAMSERLRVRTQFLEALSNGYKVVGFSPDDGYILTKELA